MKIWLTRHGQTDLNKKRLMQGRIDQPLNDTGRSQAEKARQDIGDVKFDAVYSSPLSRARETASIIGNIPMDQIIVDPRLIEVDFGIYDTKAFDSLGLRMWAFWTLPEIIPNPKSVESIKSMVARSESFLKDLEKKDYENVLVVCHGGIIRALAGYLENKKNKIKWRPRPRNCEVRVYEFENPKWNFVKCFENDN
ncbi:MAG: histidine phosphatase family protein [Bacillota bacterium]|nr:histidine phosphatase family protein [Bacillota bacterium]